MGKHTTSVLAIAGAMAAGAILADPPPEFGPGVPRQSQFQVGNALERLRDTKKLPPHPGLRFATILHAQVGFASFQDGEQGYAYPSLVTAAKRAVLSLSTLRRARTWLIANGFLVACSRWRREERTPPGESEPEYGFRSTAYIALPAPLPMLGELTDEEYALLIGNDSYRRQYRDSELRASLFREADASSSQEGGPDDDDSEECEDPGSNPPGVSPDVETNPFRSGRPEGRGESGIGAESPAPHAMASPPVVSGARHAPPASSAAAPASSASTLASAPVSPQMANPGLPPCSSSETPPTTGTTVAGFSKRETETMLGWLEELKRLTGVHLTAQQAIAMGHHYELPTPAIMRLVFDVVDWVALKAKANPQRRWTEDQITDRFRHFGIAEANKGKSTESGSPLSDAHSDQARLVREAKEREQAYEQRKAAQDRAFGQMLVNPAFRVAVDFGKSPCDATPAWKRVNTTPSGGAKLNGRAREVQRLVGALPPETHGREHGPP